MTKVLVTGGCGFIGSNLVEFLLKNTRWDIVILDNLSEGKIEDVESLPGFSERCKVIKGDIRKKVNVDIAITGCDYVVNLAAQVGVMTSVDDPLLDADINVIGTLNVLKACVENKVKRYVQASSAAPLGDQPMPLTEKCVPRPMSPYGASKLACEGYCSAFASSYGLNTVALRFSNAYGPKSYLKGSVIPIFIRDILDNKAVTIYGDGDQTRDFVHVYDMAKAIYLSLTRPGLKTFELIHIGTAKETSINQLYNTLKTIFSQKGYTYIDAIHARARKGEINRSYNDISYAKKVLGYKPEVSLESGLRQTVDWFMKDFGKDKDVPDIWV